MDTTQVVWRPTPEVIERSRLARFMRKLQVPSIEALQKRSIEEPEWYWDAVVRDLGLRWSRPYTRVLDESRGVAWPRWFEGGLLNFADNCVDRHLDAGRGAHPAVIWEGDDGTTRTVTYAELAREVNRLANALGRLGVAKGDRVGIFLPMSPEAVIATLAVLRLGAIYTPCFSGFGAQAVVSRVQDAEATVLITADGFLRRGQVVKLKETADEAVGQCPSVTTVLVLRRLGREIPWHASRDRWWHECVERESDRHEAVAVPADHPALIIYTSGTTGRPKGTVLTQGGFLIKCAHDFAYCMDVGEDDRLFWLTMFEGVQDYPGPDRLWSIVERHRVTIMGLSPTAVRALMPHGDSHPRRHVLASLRLFGSTGEPWNPEPYRWLFEVVGQGRLPIINYTGGTEISGGILSCFPITPIKPCSFYGPIPGIAADCYDEQGKPVRGQVGELVMTRPWPGMTQGFWQDPARYEETYWSRWDNVWVHGDWAYIDDDGYWFLQGRSDDTLKIAGKRLGPAEVESVLVGDDAVAEAGVIGVPHEVKGESVVCFVVLKPGVAPSETLRTALSERVAHSMGKALKPEKILFTRELPKTRSAKIMRRVIRATYLGKEAGDLSSLENPSALKAVTEAS
jgi:acetyl-CoA synthetase